MCCEGFRQIAPAIRFWNKVIILISYLFTAKKLINLQVDLAPGAEDQGGQAPDPRGAAPDQYTPHHPDSAALVPVQFTRHVAEESSDSSEDEEKLEGTDKSRSRDKKIKEVDIANLLSTFE